MKKLFTLLMLLLGVGSGAWADEDIFSANPTAAWSVPESTTDAEISSSYATISGGKMYVTNGQTSAKDLIKKQGEMAFQCTNNNTFFKVVLDKALQAGDIISTRMQSRTDADLGLWFSTANERPAAEPTSKIVLATASSQAWVSAPSYTVATGDGICGETTFYIYRHTGKSTYFNTFVITRPTADTRTDITLSFPNNSYNATLGQSFTAPTLTVDPAAASSEVTYTSSTPAVATVANDGTVTLVAGGTTTITAAISDSENYKDAFASYTLTVTDPNSTEAVVGYTEAINETTLDARVLTGADNISISEPIFGSAITDQGSKTVYIDGTAYTNNKSWRKSTSDYTNQYVGYTLTVANGYKMNVKNVNARIAVADDTYTWYVEILNGAGTQVWKSGERTTTKASSGKIDNVDVSDKEDIQGLTGNVTVNLYVKQGGSTKYFSINYLQLTVETEVDARPTYAMSVSSNDDTMGTVTPADGSTVTEGESVAFTATPTKVDYKFVKWTIDGTDYTENPYTLTNVTATHTAVATFAKRFQVTYDLGEYAGNTGKVLNNVNRDNGYDEVWSADDDSYTIPTYAHKYLYREGYIFDQWQDGDGNTYASGDKIDMTKDITLTPTWKASSQSLSASGAETVVTWSFAKADILFCDWQSDSKSGYHTQNVAVNGEIIAVPMSITAGKVGNWGRTDAIAQTNQDTKFTIPAISGMVVEMAEANVNFSSTTIAGSTDYEGTGTKSISYTYDGTAATIDIVIGENNQYLKTIKVTYPATLTEVKKSISAAGYATFCTNVPVTFGSDVTAYIATMDGTIVKFTKVDDVPANTGVLLKGTAGEKTFTVAASTTDVKANKFVGVLENTEVDGGIYVLMAGTATNQGTGFYKTSTENKFTVGANTAYLPADVAGARTFIGFDFDGDETSGINSALVNNENGEVYNLQGQRVMNAQKGLYIMNGKKVLVK